MDSSQDKIPTWVGRAVTTAEVGDLERGVGADEFSKKLPEAGTEEPVIDKDVLPLDGGITNTSHHATAADPQPGDGSADNLFGSAATNTSKVSRRWAWRRVPTGAVVGVLLGIGVLAVAGAFVLSRTSGNDISTGGSSSSEPVPSGNNEPPQQRSNTNEPSVSVSAVDIETNDSEAESTQEPTNDGTVSAGADQTVPSLSADVIEDHRRMALASGQSAWAIYSDGRVYLQGALPDRAVADDLTARLQVLLGAGNVIEQFSLDPTIPPADDPPLFIKETVVFAPDGAAMPPGSDWILVVADVLMKRYPSTDLTIVANGGSSTDVAADLQQQRSEAIVAYLVDRGISESRLAYEYRADITSGTESGNKPIEFVVRGLARGSG